MLQTESTYKHLLTTNKVCKEELDFERMIRCRSLED